MSSGWIGVDLDGTLVEYDEWRGPTHLGRPITQMVGRVRRWLTEGHEVRIFTARVADPEQRAKVVEVIEQLCHVLFGRVLAVTNIKDYDMIELWDDRCVQVEQNTGRVIGQSTRGLGG